MNKETISKLNEINRRFYQTVGEYFDSSRNYFWPGWRKFIEFLPFTKLGSEAVNVLDLGCGNARFFEFLRKEFPDLKINYTGIDSSVELLQKAQTRIDEFKQENTNCDLIEADLLEDGWKEDFTSQKFDLIVMFGLMHHIAGEESREKIFGYLPKILADDGRLIVTFWKFLNDKRLSKRIVSSDKFPTLGLDENELETGDYILDWQRGVEGFRYCHFYTEEEIEKLINKFGFKVITKYLADGPGDNVNEYLVLQQPALAG